MVYNSKNPDFKSCAFGKIVLGDALCTACKKPYCLEGHACAFYMTYEERERRLKKYGDGSAYVFNKTGGAQTDENKSAVQDPDEI